MILDLATVKQHLRAEDDAEDALIGLYALAAEESAVAFLNRAVYANEAEQGADAAGIVLNAAITAAVNDK